MTDFYKLPFPKARKHLPRIWLNLAFISDLQLDVKTLNVKAIYTATSLNPVIIVNDKITINNYLDVRNPPSSNGYDQHPLQNSQAIHIGYKHFDKWKFEDGSQIGNFRSELNLKPTKMVKLQRMIQRHALGFWGYLLFRLQLLCVK